MLLFRVLENLQNMGPVHFLQGEFIHQREALQLDTIERILEATVKPNLK